MGSRELGNLPKSATLLPNPMETRHDSSGCLLHQVNKLNLVKLCLCLQWSLSGWLYHKIQAFSVNYLVIQQVFVQVVLCFRCLRHGDKTIVSL